MAKLAVHAGLAELLARLGAAPGHALELSANELRQWPQGTVAALKAHAVLRPGKPGETAVCPGCERACVMPVQQQMRAGLPAAAFVFCDRRDDIGRVPLVAAHLERWHADVRTLGDALAEQLGAGVCQPVPAARHAFRLGLVASGTNRAPVQLYIDDQRRPALDVAGHVLALESVLTIRGGALILDTRHLGRCADAPTGGAALTAETPAKRSERLLARKAVLQQRGTRAFLRVMAQEEDVSVSMIKKILGRARQSKDAPVAGWAASLMTGRGASIGRKPKR